MKLFLSSEAISTQQVPDFTALVGKEPPETHITLIENAADVEEGPKEWLQQNREQIKGHGFIVKRVDLRDYEGRALQEALAGSDVIWLSGGNTYYLRWLLRKTGADAVIADLVGQGVVYAGSSAGAIVAGPTLKYFETADDPQAAPEVVLNGLNLTQSVVVPHMDNEKFAPVVAAINERLLADGYATVPLKDSEALIINDNETRVI